MHWRESDYVARVMATPRTIAVTSDREHVKTRKNTFEVIEVWLKTYVKKKQEINSGSTNGLSTSDKPGIKEL